MSINLENLRILVLSNPIQRKYLENMKSAILLSVIFLGLICNSCNPTQQSDNLLNKEPMESRPELNMDQAYQLSLLPLHCILVEYPNKMGQVLSSDADLKSPRQIRPAFYGCFDWHSAVHGHWTLVNILRNFPNIKNREDILSLLRKQLTEENIAVEKEFFLDVNNTTFERTYGWAWLLKLAEELYLWESEEGKQMYNNLLPLTETIIKGYLEYLPKLLYPIRTGEHSNTAFGLKLARNFAETTGHLELMNLIDAKARDFYLKNVDCPMTYEPGGHDFLSPCLEEADLMRKVLEKEEFVTWLDKFLPELQKSNYYLEPGRIVDRTDGKLVHLDGLNFSRAGVLYGIAKSHSKYQHLVRVADEHINYSLPNLTDDLYEGGHWLATFALYALQEVRGQKEGR